MNIDIKKIKALIYLGVLIIGTLFGIYLQKTLLNSSQKVEDPFSFFNHSSGLNLVFLKDVIWISKLLRG